MGCWFATCALTKLPILGGDNIVLIPIYGSVIYHPIGLPIVGRYNDYGMIEDIKNLDIAEIFYKQIQSAIERKLVKIEDGYAVKHCDGKSSYQEQMDNMKNAETLLELIERGLVHSDTDYGRGDQEVQFTMIHKKAYDMVIKEAGARIPYKADYTQRESYAYMISKVSKNYVDNHHGEFGALLGISLKESMTLEFADEHTEEEIDKLVAIAVSENDTGASIHAERDFKESFCRIFEGAPDRQYIPKMFADEPEEDVLESILDFAMIKYVFEVARISWHPDTHASYQSQEYVIPKMLADFVKYKCAEEAKECDIDCLAESANDPKRWVT